MSVIYEQNSSEYPKTSASTQTISNLLFLTFLILSFII